MIESLLELGGFTILPGAALVAGTVYSFREIRRLGQLRIVVILLVLGLMLFHQVTELQFFLESGRFRDPIAGEIPETSANLIAAASVSHLLALLCRERELKTDLERSKAELESVTDRLELIFENVNDGILLIDLDEEAIIEANQSAVELLRYERHELEGLSPHDIHPHEPELFDELTKALRPDGGVVSEKLSCRRKDGSLMPAAISASRATLDGTDVLLVTIRDNSERQQHRSQVDLLTRVLRHNLRNDVNVVAGYLDAIEAKTDDPSIEDLAAKSAARCDALVEVSDKTRRLNEILDLERDALGALTDLPPLVERIVEAREREHPSARIETDLPEQAIVAASQNVEWAIEELLENAIVHAEGEPHVRVDISTETIENEGLRSEWVAVTVADRGPGIPESEVAVLDDESNRTQVLHGEGIGLWIVQQLARIFDGQLDIDRRPDSEWSTEVSLRLQPGRNGHAIASGDG
jgi:PAS domain S-box-containing protein